MRSIDHGSFCDSSAMSTQPPESSSVRPTQAQRRAATRRRLIDGSLDVFARSGFHAASLEEIAAKAGVSIGAVYYNFSSKEDLFQELLEEPFHRILDNVRVASAGRGSAAHLFLRAIEDIPGRLPPHMELTAYATRTPRVREDVGRRSVRNSRQQFSETLEQLAGQLGELLSMPVTEVATAVDAIMHGFAIGRLFDPDSVSDRLVDEALLRVAFGATG